MSSYGVEVPIRLQTTQMSCWWAAASMILEAFGQRYQYPWDRNPVFARRSDSWQYSVRGAGPDAARWTHTDAAVPSADVRDPEQQFYSRPGMVLDPSEWYDHGCPPDRHHIQYLAHLLRFRFAMLDRTFFTPESLERDLRGRGPQIMVRRLLASDMQGPSRGRPPAALQSGGGLHAVVIRAVNNFNGSFAVEYIDPARGNQIERFDDFRSRLLAEQFILYLATSTGRPQVSYDY